MPDQTLIEGCPKVPQRWHTLMLFLAYQLPLLAVLLWFGPSTLWQTAESNLAGITACCVFRRYVWIDSANCMACSLFCTFTVWSLHLASEVAIQIAELVEVRLIAFAP